MFSILSGFYWEMYKGQLKANLERNFMRGNLTYKFKGRTDIIVYTSSKCANMSGSLWIIQNSYCNCLQEKKVMRSWTDKAVHVLWDSYITFLLNYPSIVECFFICHYSQMTVTESDAMCRIYSVPTNLLFTGQVRI